MKLFLDTSNKMIICALINDKKHVIDFVMKESNNSAIQDTLPTIEKMLSKNKITINSLTDFYITNGPGSFTGVKIPLNIIKTLNISNPDKINTIRTINTFDLIKEKNKKYTLLPFGKEKYFIKPNKGFGKEKLINSTEFGEYNKEELTIGYNNFTKEKLEELINSNIFKTFKNIDKIKLSYLNNYK